MLHIICQSPFESPSFENCLTIFSPEKDRLLLIENGVFCALSRSASGDQLIDAATQKKVFVLAPHAAERAVSLRLIANLQLINFEGFVDLVAEHHPVLRW